MATGTWDSNLNILKTGNIGERMVPNPHGESADNANYGNAEYEVVAAINL